MNAKDIDHVDNDNGVVADATVSNTAAASWPVDAPVAKVRGECLLTTSMALKPPKGGGYGWVPVTEFNVIDNTFQADKKRARKPSSKVSIIILTLALRCTLMD